VDTRKYDPTQGYLVTNIREGKQVMTRKQGKMLRRKKMKHRKDRRIEIYVKKRERSIISDGERGKKMVPRPK
jgi:hypothetical protein